MTAETVVTREEIRRLWERAERTNARGDWKNVALALALYNLQYNMVRRVLRPWVNN